MIKVSTRIIAGLSNGVKLTGSGFILRGALKLKSVLEKLDLEIKGKTVLDAGSSHGGFTQVMLQEGAGKVYAVDVGKGLLDWKLRNLPQVTVMEGVNARNLKKENFDQVPQIGLIDVSFISLKKILPVIFDIVTETVLALLKPQFEARYEEASKGKGVIKSPQIHKRVIEEVKQAVKDKRWEFIGTFPSEVKGRKGNIEYFLYYERVRSQ